MLFSSGPSSRGHQPSLHAFLCCLLLYLSEPGSVFAGFDDYNWNYPVAPHILLVVPAGGVKELSLPGYNLQNDDKLHATITTLPTKGTAYQLSKVYNDYGYDPKLGLKISQNQTRVSGSGNRFFYQAPFSEAAPYGKWDTLQYTISTGRRTSAPGTISIVPPNGILIGSSFARDIEGWTIVGNRKLQASLPVAYNPTSRGLMNRYVYGTDDLINAGPDGTDQALWYFNAPKQFLGNQGMAYGGSLNFVLSSFSGDFSTSNLNSGAYLVYLECATCNSNSGVRLGLPLTATTGFSGSDTVFTLELTEKAGWLQDSKNTLKAWVSPSRCTFIQVLSSLSSLTILGDFTKWYESVSLDSVALQTFSPSLPLCAQGSPDAFNCNCT